ncbi:hypothetical protein Tamer19_13570 [Cupriavidus sp. TA19]|uniref:hypothetical protein n=1 Tax=unclassified Cupriavidus TaxID=2640874 RepID=UPI0027294392|nr:hypothetical protein [Cupriavidus sp. TA19]GLC91949.1 hypothetical protein Tamer19_13570 [Cupriavidus sp. TA19]
MDKKNKFELTESPRQPSILDLAREQLTPYFDQTAIARIVQAGEEIAIARERIFSEHVMIGSRLTQIQHIMCTSLTAHRADPAKAANEARTLLYRFAEHSLKIPKWSAKRYVQIYERFMHNNDALTFLNVGELNTLKRQDITADEVALVIKAKKANESFSRSEILPFIDRYRALVAEMDTLETQLAGTEEELSASMAQQDQYQFELKYLKEQIAAAGRSTEAQEAALIEAQTALASQSANVDALQTAIQKVNREKADLQSQLADIKIRVEVKEVPVVPEGYASLTQAIADAQAKLQQVASEIQASEEKLASMQAAIAANETSVHSPTARHADRSISLRLDGLLADFDSLREKFQSCRQARELHDHRSTLSSLAASVAIFHQELLAAAKAA